MMKYAHVKAEQDDSAQQQNRKVFCSFTWITGFINLLIGTVFNTVALRIGNQFLLSSTCALSIIFNTLLSVCFLKESIQQSDVISLALISAGCTLFMLTAKASDQTYSQSELLDLFMRPISVIFISISAVFILSSFAFEEKVLRELKQFQKCL